ncbi:serine/threonine-protein phosphatase [Akkermansiaceae bacterium]|nr:serine/threonine-protein phosphatase [Akkermansiaceae bacterium]
MGQVCQIEWAGATRSGSRKERNDDSWIVFSADAKGSRQLAESGKMSISDQDLVFAVSDGMGGGNAGHLASALLLERMAELIPETFKSAAMGFFPDSMSYLEQLIKDVHEHINEAALASVDCGGMAATLALAWFSPENMYLANVGDSRIYRCRDGKTEQLSKDHTSAWGQLARGEISEFEYRKHPRRAALYRVIGGGKPGGAPHFAAVQYQPGDRFMVCSDGLIDGLWERHIRDALADGGAPAECCEKLLQRAMENAGRDDTTLIVIHVS